MPVTMSRSWDTEFPMRVDRAAASAIIGMGAAIAIDTKRVSHRVSGNLVRSVHTAPLHYEGGEEDLKHAQSEDLMVMSAMGVEPVKEGNEMLIEVGSWLPYACVEWIGRGHPGINEGVEMVRGSRADAIVAAAFAREGLI